MNTEQIAKICYESTRAYCEVLSEKNYPGWENIEEWRRKFTIKSVEIMLKFPNIPISKLHDRWLAKKIKDGWRFAEEKNIDRKEHLGIKDYENLPLEHKMQDYLFGIIVNFFREYHTVKKKVIS